MELDTKQKVLLAIYMEYQKDRPDMQNAITAQNLGIDNDVLRIALAKLDNEGLVNGIAFCKGDSRVLGAYVNNAKMSSYGIEYVETKLQIDPAMTGKEKVEKVIAKTAEWGFEQLKDIGVKVLAEIAKAQMGL